MTDRGARSLWRRRVALGVALVLLLAAAWVAPPDTLAREHVDAGLKRALASFAAARALNAVISVAQGTELAVQPAGVGMTLTPGEVLDPVNDLVEQFSTLMLAASVAFGLELLLINIGGHWLVSTLLTLAALGWAALRWRKREPPAWLTRVATPALVVLLLVRFAVPVIALTSEAVFQQFMAADYAAGQAGIERSSDEVATLSTPPGEAPREPGLTERFKRWWSDNADIGARLEALKQAANRTVDHIVRLIAVFLLQTLVLPLLLLWLLLRALRLLR